MEISHTNLTEVTWVVFVEIDAMMVLAAGITTTSWVLTVLANTTMTVAHVTT